MLQHVFVVAESTIVVIFGSTEFTESTELELRSGALLVCNPRLESLEIDWYVSRFITNCYIMFI